MKTLGINWLIITFIIGMIFFFACTKLDRVNPYDDKANLSPEEWAPQNLSIEDISITKKKLSWTYEDKNIEGFKIERRIGIGAWDSPFPLIKKDFKTFTDTTVIPDTSFNYEYRLNAVAGNNESTQLSVSSKAVFPGPSDLKIVINNESAATITWTDNTNGEEGFIIEKKTNNENWQVLATVNKNIISYQDNSFSLITTVNYRVSAIARQIVSFSIEGLIHAPTIITSDVADLSTSTSQCGGTISGINIPEILDKGVCYGISQNPTIEGAYSNAGSGSGSFSIPLSPLAENTLYYFRAYATTIAGTFYGEEKSFTTLPITLPVVTTSPVSGIAQTTAISGGTVTYDGGSPVFVKGVCWSTNMNPTISDNHSNDGDGTVNYVSNLTGLLSNTFYYVRAFATNSLGTSYGEEITFTTLSYEPPVVITKAITEVTTNSAESGGFVISDGGSSVTSKGICWDTSVNPTLLNSYTNDGTGISEFVSVLNGLSENTLYFVRAYATNNIGTSYGENISFTSNGYITDIDGNVYLVINIGAQFWMAENLRVTHYNNGDVLPDVTSPSGWGNLYTGAYCWYGNSETYADIYGPLYNWYAVTDSRSLCPTGWHIPSDEEFLTLSNFLGGVEIAGGKLKEVGTIHWVNPNTEATNETGFTGLPGGNRNDSGVYDYIFESAGFWTTTESITNAAWFRGLAFNYGSFGNGSTNKRYGFSVRCVKD